jgi:O-antigen/teichoic acid export membrane protein
MKYIGRIYGVAIPYCLIAIIMWIVLFSKCPIGLYKQCCSFGITVGFPIVFHSLAQNILSQSDRVMMQFMNVSSSEIGIYSLFYSLSAVLGTVLNALNISWCPFYYDDVYAKRWDTLNRKCKNYIELFSALAVIFLLLSREVSYVMADNSYWGGINIIPILVFAVFFTFMYQFPVNFEFFHKKTKIIAIGTVCSGLLNIFLNVIMIPLWGMYGAAVATALSYGALFVMHYYIVRNMKEHPYHLRVNVFSSGLISVIIGTILFYTLSPWWYLRWGIGIIIGLFEAYRIWIRKSIF